MSVQPWADRAACRGLDSKLHDRYFYPGTSGRAAPNSAYDYAKNTWCRRCEVREECLQWALDNDERYGLWGGHTPGERKQLKNQIERQHGTLTGYRQHYEYGDFPPCPECSTRRAEYDVAWRAGKIAALPRIVTSLRVRIRLDEAS